MDYCALARGIEVSEAHFAIVKSQASNSSVEKEAFAYMAGTLEEVAKRLEEHAQVQREQLGMICAQQESIDVCKQMLTKLLKKKKKPKTKRLLSRAKGIEVDSSASEGSDGEDANFEKPPIPPKQEGSDAESDHSKRMSELEKHLEALAN